MKYIALGLLALLSFSTMHADIEEKTAVASKINFNPLGPVNHFDLVLTVGMDELFDQSPLTYGLDGFTSILGWNQSQIDTFRNEAVQWFLERFGIDFTNGYYDAASGTISTPIATLAPLSLRGKNRVLASNNLDVLPYSLLTPTRVEVVEYVAFFNGVPFNYTGTVAGGATMPGNFTETLSYCVYKISKNFSGSNKEIVFMRSFYPTRVEPLESTPAPARTLVKAQLFSPKYGSGFCVINSAIPLSPDANNKWPVSVRAVWTFPGSFEIPDWNGFTTAPVAL